MSYNVDDFNVGGQLKVGTGIDVAPIQEGDKKINGSMFAEGPVVFGRPDAFSEIEGTLMVGPIGNNDPDMPEDTSPYKTVLGLSGAQPQALYSKGNLYVEGDIFVTGSVDCFSSGRLEARHRVADKSPKLFDMEHPSKGEGHRLAHACTEGPEVGVYYRGRLRNNNVIELPTYWKDLVHTDSISVQLQPIGAHQDIIIKRWDDEKVHLQSRGPIPIDCFYHVYAERKDVNALVVEYEGKTHEDRPDRDGDDPKYAEVINTRTR